MPRNPAGLYSLPDPPVVGGNTILATDENVTRNDIATELSNSLDRQGRGGMLAPFKIFDGTESVPGLGFLSDVNTGMFRDTIDVFKLGFSVNGAKVMGLSPGGGKIISDVAGDGLRITSKAVGAQTLYLWSSDSAVGIFDQAMSGGNGIAIQTAASQIDFNIGGLSIALIDVNGVDVAGGRHLRVKGGTYTAPSSGAGVELFYDVPGGGYGAILAYDRSFNAYRPMWIMGTTINMNIAGVSRLLLDGTKLTLAPNTLVDAPGANFQASVYYCQTPAGSLGLPNDGNAYFMSLANYGAIIQGGGISTDVMIANRNAEFVAFVPRGTTQMNFQGKVVVGGVLQIQSPFAAIGDTPVIGWLPITTSDGVARRVAIV